MVSSWERIEAQINQPYRNLFDKFSSLFARERQCLSFGAALLCIRRTQKELHCVMVPGLPLTWVLFLSKSAYICLLYLYLFVFV